MIKAPRQIHEPAFPQPYPPQSFEKAMVFIDGTNFLNRLRGCGVTLPNLNTFARMLCGQRQLLRSYFYSTTEKVEKARTLHGEGFFVGTRVVCGTSVATADGGIREKGVDALLVADLVYHAAQKNCSYAVLVSNDSDFEYALKRVEDFGCGTGLLAVGIEAAPRLRNACDDYTFVDTDGLIAHYQASKLPQAE